jgi:gas vesicle protein
MNIKKDLLKEAESYLPKDNTSTIAALLAGVAIGAVIGLLFAPSAGNETRTTLADSLKDLGGTVADKARQGKESLNNLKDKAVDAIKSKVSGDEVDNPSYS